MLDAVYSTYNITTTTDVTTAAIMSNRTTTTTTTTVVVVSSSSSSGVPDRAQTEQNKQLSLTPLKFIKYILSF